MSSSGGADLEAAGPSTQVDEGGVAALASEGKGAETSGVAPMSIDESYAAATSARLLEWKRRRRDRMLIGTACVAMAIAVVVWIFMPWASKDRGARWPKEFEGAIFLAEGSSSLDAVAAAIGASELYRGFAACAAPKEKCLGEADSQTRRAFDYFGLDPAKPIGSFPKTFKEHPKPGVVLVDFNAPAGYPSDTLAEAPKLVSEDGKWLPSVLGVLDRHAMNIPGVMQTKAPEAIRETKDNIVIFSAPSAATSTIVARHCQQAQCHLSQTAANLLIAAIHSRAKVARISAEDREAIRFLTPLADSDKLLRQSYWSQVVGEAACGWEREEVTGKAAGEACNYSDFSAFCGVLNAGATYFGNEEAIFGGDAKAGTCAKPWLAASEERSYEQRFTCQCKSVQVPNDAKATAVAA